MFGFLAYLAFLATSVSPIFSGNAGVNGNTFGASALQGNLVGGNLKTEPNNQTEMMQKYLDYAEQQAQAQQILVTLTGGQTDGLSILDSIFNEDGSLSTNITFLNQDPIVGSVEDFFKDTVVDGKFVGDTGSELFNQLVQAAVNNDINPANLFVIEAGKLRVKS